MMLLPALSAGTRTYRGAIEAKQKCQPQPTPAIQPDSTEDWESGI